MPILLLIGIGALMCYHYGDIFGVECPLKKDAELIPPTPPPQE